MQVSKALNPATTITTTTEIPMEVTIDLMVQLIQTLGEVMGAFRNGRLFSLTMGEFFSSSTRK
jgi:hypothetical protein